MCMMSVKYTDDSGDEIVVENITRLVQRQDSIKLVSLFEEPVLLPGKWSINADFDKGVTRLSPEIAP